MTAETSPSPDDSELLTYDDLWGSSARSVRDLPAVVLRSFRMLRRAAPRLLIVTIAIQVISGLLAGIQLVIGRGLLSRVLDERRVTVAAVVPWGLAFVGVLTALAVLSILRSETQRILAESVARDAQREVTRAAASAELIDFDRPAFHNRLQRVLANSTFRPVAITSSFVGSIGAGVAMTAVVITLGSIEPVLVLIAVVGSVPLWLATRATTKINIAFEVEQTEPSRQRDYLLYLLSTRDSAKELRAYRLGGFLSRRHGALWDTRIVRLRQLTRRRAIIGSASQLANGAVMAGVLFTLVLLIDRGRITVAEAGVAAGAIVLLAQRAGVLVGGIGSMLESAAFLREVDDFLSDARQRELRAEARDTFIVGSEGVLNIVVSNVSFRYPGADVDALRGIDIALHTGEIVALVGANGSGKTTLAKMIAGLYTPDTGSIFWNGRSMSDFGESIRDHSAYVFQDFARYMFSAGDNIGLGRWEEMEDEVRVIDAAGRAGAAPFIDELRGGYSSILGPQFLGGTDLSIGQWQRIALARAFFRDAGLIVLDEPSSALDPDAEAALFADLRLLCRGKAVLVISHRFSTVAGADRIYVLDAGAIIEQGTHVGLLAAGGTYARLFNLQASAYS
jgi:ATP-binding cassette, subfamily B, bacterial